MKHFGLAPGEDAIFGARCGIISGGWSRTLFSGDGRYLAGRCTEVGVIALFMRWYACAESVFLSRRRIAHRWGRRKRYNCARAPGVSSFDLGVALTETGPQRYRWQTISNDIYNLNIEGMTRKRLIGNPKRTSLGQRYLDEAVRGGGAILLMAGTVMTLSVVRADEI